jgi:hypothetical protein
MQQISDTTSVCVNAVYFGLLSPNSNIDPSSLVFILSDKGTNL